MLQSMTQVHGSFIHVFLVGTRKTHRNKGMGAALLEYINRHADEGGMHCYLEVTYPHGSLSAVQSLIRQGLGISNELWRHW